MKPLIKLEKTCTRISRIMSRAGSFLRYFNTGMELEYPICCTAQFAWEVSSLAHMRRRMSKSSVPFGPAVKRGAIFAGLREDGETQKIYVPCSLHKGRHPGWKPYPKKPRHTQLKLF